MAAMSGPDVPTEAAHCPLPLPGDGAQGVQRTLGASNCDCAFNPFHEDTLVSMPPRLRRGGTLARTLYNKAVADQELRRMDKRSWYAADMQAAPAHVRDTFLEMDLDEATADFLEQAEAKSESILLQIWHSLVKLLLGWFFTQTSLNGFLGRGSMFVFSTPQFGRLLGGHAHGRLLDIGAGDGAVTAAMQPFFDNVSVTEVSQPMRRTLARRHYTVLEIEDWTDHGPWDVIACLNVLDRCARPGDLLGQIHGSLAEGGRAVIALVLPYQPYVEVGGKDNHQPEERMPIEGRTFAEQAASFVTHVLAPAGFSVERWTRLPYLCEGDLQQAYYWLPDALFVVRRTQDLTDSSQCPASSTECATVEKSYRFI